MIKIVDAGFWNTRLQQLPAIQSAQVEMPLAIFLKKFLPYRVGFDKLVINLVAHFKATLADAGPDNSLQTGRLNLKQFRKPFDRAGGNVHAGTAPTGVNSRNSPITPDEKRQAVSRKYTDWPVSQIGNQTISLLGQKKRSSLSDLKNPVLMNLVAVGRPGHGILFDDRQILPDLCNPL